MFRDQKFRPEKRQKVSDQNLNPSPQPPLSQDGAAEKFWMVHKPRTGLDSLPFACGLGDVCRRSNSKNKPKKRKFLDESHVIISQLCSFRVGDQILAAISESENW